MSYETICLDADTPAHRAAAYAISMNVRRLLVVSHRDLVGVLAVVDLLRPLADAVRVLARGEEAPIEWVRLPGA